MRKLTAIAVTVITLAGAGIALASVATDSTGRFIDLKVAVTPPVAGTASAPQGVGLSFESFIGNRIDGNRRSQNKTITVRFNKGFTGNAPLFPACKINPTVLTKCSSSTEVGRGTAEGSVPGANGAPPSFVPATLVAYNGKPFRKDKSPTLIIIALVNGKPFGELDFTVKQQPSGPYGLTFDEILFPTSGQQAFDITKFNLKIPDRTVTRKVHGKSVKVHLIVAPTTCHGSWKFAQTNTFSDGSPPLTATDSQPCATR